MSREQKAFYKIWRKAIVSSEKMLEPMFPDLVAQLHPYSKGGIEMDVEMKDLADRWLTVVSKALDLWAIKIEQDATRLEFETARDIRITAQFEHKKAMDLTPKPPKLNRRFLEDE